MLSEEDLDKLADDSIEKFSVQYESDYNGNVSYYIIDLTKIQSEDRNNKLVVIFHDDTEKIELIRQLEQKLSDNNLLIGEVHHRVKNYTSPKHSQPSTLKITSLRLLITIIECSLAGII